MAPPNGTTSIRDISQAQTALSIMGALSDEMKKKKIPYVDQFYHCLAACRTTQETGNAELVLELMSTKEVSDYWLGRVGLYGRKKFFTHAEMQEDNNKDKAVNEYGVACKPGESCLKRCRRYLDLMPKSHRYKMSEYVPAWAGEPK